MALIESISVGLLGGGFAILGGFLNNRYSKHNSDAQRDFDKWKSNRDLYVTKGEELFEYFNKWHDYYSQIQNAQVFRMLNDYTNEQVIECYKANPIKEVQPRIESLIALFFPVLGDQFQQITKIMGESALAYSLFLSKQSSHTDVVKKIVNNMELIRPKCDELRRHLAEEVKKHI
ncbi:hypothetical protein ACSFCT_03280 [Yokenella regensburgei]|uniref:hypothetical protein n=1 Tax=Yokenella regensburgei TaxID=158877 RepID=UPI003EDA15AE